MECPRGSTCTESTHEVKTIDKALEWFDQCHESDLPITINTFKSSNGRMRVKIYSKNQLIYKRG